MIEQTEGDSLNRHIMVTDFLIFVQQSSAAEVQKFIGHRQQFM